MANTRDLDQRGFEMVVIDELSEEEWMQIRFESVKMRRTIKDDDLKCAVMGFFNWMMKYKKCVGIDFPEDGVTH